MERTDAGKKKEGLRVIKDSGRPITPAESVGRNLLRIVDQLPAFYAVGIGSVLLSGKTSASAISLRARLWFTKSRCWKPSQSGNPPRLGKRHPRHVRIRRLTPEEFSLIEAFLNREVRFH